MTMRERAPRSRAVEVAVVGAGPAGIAAATEAARAGLATLLIDENPLDPAFMQRNIPKWFGSRGIARRLSLDSVYRWLEARPALQEAVDVGVDVLTQHAVWGAFDDASLGVFDGTRTWRLQAQHIILATGTTDLHLAFPGWTIGGVLGAGGALHLLETFGHLDGARRMVVLGGGNLGLCVARRALAASIAVPAVVEVGAMVGGHPALCEELTKAGVRFLTRHTVREARGGAEVESVMLLEVQPDGEPRRGSAIEIEADTLCVAIGRQPAVELPYLLGCELGFDAERGGAYPLHDVEQRTTRAGVAVAGNLCGAPDATFLDHAGAEASGKRAARATLAALRAHASASASAPVTPPAKSRPASHTSASYSSEWHRLADLLADDETIVCRCEEITRGQVLAAADLVGCEYPDDVKRVSRAGMGPCQGRGCRPIVSGILAARGQRSLADLPLASYRPPIRPLPMAALASEEERAAPRPVAFLAAEARLARDIEAGELNPMAAVRFWRTAEEVLYGLTNEGAGDPDLERAALEVERKIRYSHAVG
jgi:thioredoxin reductase